MCLRIGTVILSRLRNHWWILTPPTFGVSPAGHVPRCPSHLYLAAGPLLREIGYLPSRRAGIASLGLSVPMLLRAQSSLLWCLWVAGRDDMPFNPEDRVA